MEAKDTVMSPQQRVTFDNRFTTGKVHLRELAEAQAEISYKAGMKEVVEWVKANKSCRSDFMTPGEFYFRIDENEWQAFLKEIET